MMFDFSPLYAQVYMQVDPSSMLVIDFEEGDMDSTSRVTVCLLKRQVSTLLLNPNRPSLERLLRV
jgi:hypothetical protein